MDDASYLILNNIYW